MIKMVNGVRHYYDKHGKAITDGSKIRYESGRVKEVVLLEDEQLGTDATNPKWIESGRAYAGEYGYYPLTRDETEEVEVIA